MPLVDDAHHAMGALRLAARSAEPAAGVLDPEPQVVVAALRKDANTGSGRERRRRDPSRRELTIASIAVRRARRDRAAARRRGRCAKRPLVRDLQDLLGVGAPAQAVRVEPPVIDNLGDRGENHARVEELTPSGGPVAAAGSSSPPERSAPACRASQSSDQDASIDARKILRSALSYFLARTRPDPCEFVTRGGKASHSGTGTGMLEHRRDGAHGNEPRPLACGRAERRGAPAASSRLHLALPVRVDRRSDFLAQLIAVRDGLEQTRRASPHRAGRGRLRLSRRSRAGPPGPARSGPHRLRPARAPSVPRRVDEHVVARQRAVDERLLLAAGAPRARRRARGGTACRSRSRASRCA